MKFKNILILVCSLSWLTSCNSYLDLVPEDDILTVPKIFETRSGAFQWKVDAYTGCGTLCVNMGTNCALVGADEYTAGNYAREAGNLTNLLISDGLQTALQPINNMWAFDQIYYRIRYCNTFLENIDKVYNLRSGELETWIAEVKAVKAFYYFELVKRYGPIVLVPRNIGVYEPLEVQRQQRSSLDSCFKEITDLLTEAIPDLQVMSEKDVSQREFFSKEGAMGLKARVLLYAASPLFNGGIAGYRGGKSKNGGTLFPEETDKEKWRIAAEYADEVIAYLEGQGFKLITGNATEKTSLLNTMRDLENSIWAPNFKNSTEAVWIVAAVNPNWMPIAPQLGTVNTDPHYSVWAQGILGTNIRMVNKFYTANGLPVEEDKTWKYGDGYRLAQESDPAYMDVVPLKTDVLALHLNREPRFYSTIAAPGLYWQLGPRTTTKYHLLVDSRCKQLFGIQQDRVDPSVRQNVTGYWVKKGIYSDFDLPEYQTNWTSWNQHANVVMRLAELYLIAAEAWNEYEGPNGSHRSQIFDRLNKVRERAGIPSVQVSWGNYGLIPDKFNTQSGLRDIIHRERTIEFMYEGHRFWDVRRWGTAVAEGLNEKPMGWNVAGKTWQEFYNNYQGPVVVWDKALFNPARGYLFPIKSEEVMISGLEQNPGW